MMNIRNYASSALLLSFVLTSAAFAQDQYTGTSREIIKLRDEQAKKLANMPKQEEPAKSGVLAGYNNGSSVVTPGLWGENQASSGGEGAPIEGSILKVSDSVWKMRVSNTSQDRYVVTVAVVQYDANGKKIRSSSYPYNLTAGRSSERQIRVTALTANCSLELKNWKKIERKKTPEEIKSEIDEKTKEISELESEL